MRTYYTAQGTLLKDLNMKGIQKRVGIICV